MRLDTLHYIFSGAVPPGLEHPNSICGMAWLSLDVDGLVQCLTVLTTGCVRRFLTHFASLVNPKHHVVKHTYRYVHDFSKTRSQRKKSRVCSVISAILRWATWAWKYWSIWPFNTKESQGYGKVFVSLWDLRSNQRFYKNTVDINGSPRNSSRNWYWNY